MPTLGNTALNYARAAVNHIQVNFSDYQTICYIIYSVIYTIFVVVQLKCKITDVCGMSLHPSFLSKSILSIHHIKSGTHPQGISLQQVVSGEKFKSK